MLLLEIAPACCGFIQLEYTMVRRMEVACAVIFTMGNPIFELGEMAKTIAFQLEFDKYLVFFAFSTGLTWHRGRQFCSLSG